MKDDGRGWGVSFENFCLLVTTKKDDGRGWSVSSENCCSFVTKALLENAKRWNWSCKCQS